jgi:hypothetical protein
MKEADFEKAVTAKIKKAGGRAFKWVCPGMAGVPDRIIVLPGGKIIFAEIKRPGRKNGLSIRQKKVAALLEQLGCTVVCINSIDELEEILKNEI